MAPLLPSSSSSSSSITNNKTTKKFAVLPQISTATMHDGIASSGQEHNSHGHSNGVKECMNTNNISDGHSQCHDSHHHVSASSNAIAPASILTTSTDHHSPTSAISMHSMKHATSNTSTKQQREGVSGDLSHVLTLSDFHIDIEGDGGTCHPPSHHHQDTAGGSGLSSRDMSHMTGHNSSNNNNSTTNNQQCTSLSASRRHPSEINHPHHRHRSQSYPDHAAAIPLAGMKDEDYHTRSYSTSSNPRSAVEGSFMIPNGRSSTSSSRPVSRTQSRPSSRPSSRSALAGRGSSAISRSSTPLLGNNINFNNDGNTDNIHAGNPLSSSSSSFLTSGDYAALGTDENDHEHPHSRSHMTTNNNSNTSRRISNHHHQPTSILSYLSPSYLVHRIRQTYRNAKAALAIGVPGEWKDLKTGKWKIPAHLKAYVPLLIWVAISILSGIIVGVFHDQVFSGLDSLSTYLKEQGFLGDLILYLCIFITTFPPLPLYSTLIILSGYSFGLMEGFIISYTAALSGAVVVFLISKIWLKNSMDSLLDKSQGLKKVVRAIEKRPNLLWLIRVSPYPYNVMNVLLASSNTLSFSCYFWCTALALPKLLIHCSIGTTIRSFAESAKSSNNDDGIGNGGDGSEELEREQSGQRMKAIAGLVGGILCFGVFIYIMIIARRAVDDLDDSDRLPSMDSDTRSRSSTIGGESNSPNPSFSHNNSPSRNMVDGKGADTRLGMTEYHQPLSVREVQSKRDRNRDMDGNGGYNRGRSPSGFKSESRHGDDSNTYNTRSSISGGAYLPYEDGGGSSNTSHEGGFGIDMDIPNSESTRSKIIPIPQYENMGTMHQRHSFERQDSSMPFVMPSGSAVKIGSTQNNNNDPWHSTSSAYINQQGYTVDDYGKGDDGLLLGSEVVNRLEEVASRRSSPGSDGK